MSQLSNSRRVTLTSLAMIAFAGNSLLCRLALKHTGIDAASFTTVRLVSGALMLWVMPFAAILSTVMATGGSMDPAGLGYAVASGALASGLGYSIWYTALPALKATSAATVQLSVPVIAALGGVVLLGEPISWRLVLTSVAILGGIALVIAGRHRPGSKETSRR